MQSNAENVDFTDGMKQLLGLDSDALESVLDRLDADELQDLTDAVATNDKEAAERIVNSNTDEEVNTLFRGKNLDDVQAKKKRRRNEDGDMQFAFGDDVMINVRDEHGKMHSISATVDKPNGPEGSDTMVVKVKGKSRVVDKKDVDRLDEQVIGMVGLPNLQRIQQLAGIQAQGDIAITPSLPAPAPTVAQSPDNPLGCAMVALDALEAALPNIILADLKLVRERLARLQTSLNEGHRPRTVLGRSRK